MSKQLEIHGYTKEGAYRGVYVATLEQFAETGLVRGAPPRSVPTKEDVLDEYRVRVANFINQGTSRRTYGDAMRRRDELVLNLLALNSRVADGETLSAKEEATRKIIAAGVIELARLEDVSKKIASLTKIPANLTEDSMWAPTKGRKP